MSRTADELVVALESLEDIQQRIDLVARDFKSRRNTYAKIDAWTLGELLGLDFDDTGDWLRHCFVYRHELEDAGFDHPFAENVHLLEGQIPPERYRRLASLAEATEGNDKDDLPLTKKEVALIREAYVEAHVAGSSCGMDVCHTTLTSTGGIELDFEVCIDDSGESCDAKSPYDLRRGEGFDASDLVKIS